MAVRVGASQSPYETPDVKLREQTVERVARLAARVAALPDSEQKETALADLARDLCLHDRVQASRLFFQANDVLLRIASTGNRVPKYAKIETEWFIRPRRDFLILRARACEAALAEKLAASAPVLPPPRAMDPVAESLMPDDDKPGGGIDESKLRQALDTSGTSLWQTATDGDVGQRLSSWIQALARFRSINAEASDRLFLDATRLAAGVSAIPAVNLMMMGAYLFRSKADNGALNPGWGDAGAIHNITFDVDPGTVNSSLARAYLELSLDVLRQHAEEADNHNENVERFLLATKLTRTARGVAPDLASLFDAVARQFSSDAARASEDDEIATLIKAETRPPRLHDAGLHAEEADIAEESVGSKRDFDYLLLASVLRQRKKQARAREVIEKIENREASGAMLRLLQLDDAVAALDRDELDRAEQIARHMPPGTERALLRLAFAAKRNRPGERDATLARAFAALHDADSLAAGASAGVKLAAIPVVAPLDAKLAVELFKQVALAMEDSSVVVQGSVEISISARMIHSEAYNVTGKAFTVVPDLRKSVAAVVAQDADAVEAIVLGSSNEMLINTAVPVLASSMLARLAKMPKRP